MFWSGKPIITFMGDGKIAIQNKIFLVLKIRAIIFSHAERKSSRSFLFSMHNQGNSISLSLQCAYLYMGKKDLYSLIKFPEIPSLF